ncbi:sensor histidine kinase [Methylophaga sp. OBS4]|uniref:sensor histidine kinase n=1 Tax=Methylophaga sp. OBS4 TaxID=2991935 RepID=UPI00225926B2|nr:PAS domain S-box protein [Methylophaga sp. OBS4]MCX4188030.1 PAS domain S-box protein [Methylophaga sp. OBS4]
MLRSTAQLTAIIDSVPTAIVMVDNQGHIEFINAQTERLFGYQANELLGETIEILVPHRFRGNHPALRNQFTNNPVARPMGAGRDLYGLRKDGSEFPIEIGLNPISTEEGLFIVSAIVDISERKRLEARFRATIESAPTAMVMIDQTGTIVLINHELERLFGYSRDELLTQKIEILIPQRYRAAHPGLRTQYFVAPAARRMGAGRDLSGVRKDGSEFPVEIGLSPVNTDEGLFVIGTIVDISERTRQANETLQRLNENLERSNIELQRFAYIASHDLQTPMRSIVGFIQLLQSTYADKLDDKANDWIDRVVNATKHLQTLVQDLLTYSRVDSQASPFGLISMTEVFDRAVALVDTSITESEAEISHDDLPDVMGDDSQLVQLLQNLICNAIVYRGKKMPRIHISAEYNSNEWIFAVQDNGIGIHPKHQQRIFEIFQRLHEPQEYPGTGIGLTICRRIVHRHGGRMWVESEPEKGSTFYFTIANIREA